MVFSPESRKEEEEHSRKQAEMIFERLVTTNFMKFLRVLILKGADPNCFGFSNAVIYEYYASDERIMEKSMVPMDRVENEKIAKWIDHARDELTSKPHGRE